MVTGNYKNSRVAILVNSRKFDAHEIYVFYSTSETQKSNRKSCPS